MPLDDFHAFVTERLAYGADAFAGRTKNKSDGSSAGRLHPQALPDRDLAEHADIQGDGDDLELVASLANSGTCCIRRSPTRTACLMRAPKPRACGSTSGSGESGWAARTVGRIVCKHADSKLFGRQARVSMSRFERNTSLEACKHVTCTFSGAWH